MNSLESSTMLTEMLDGFTLQSFLPVAAVFVLAGLVKGVVGLGLPTISMALLSIFMAPAQAAALLVIPSLVTNVWQTRPVHALGPMLRRIGGMQAGVAAGTLAGAALLGAPAGAWAAVSLGVALIAYSAWTLFGKPLAVPPRAEKWMGPLVGAVTGFITAVTGVFVVPAVPYLQSLGLARDALIQAMGVSFTVSTVALAVGLWMNDSYSFSAASASLLMLLPALIGMGAGQRLRQSLAPAVFRRCFLISLAIVGIYLAIKGLWP
ncbi:sulfite exporter TauE/SafE family protein [Pusillimonas sp. SM2304]|uniref:sulfite exporter TauE/SafE family protein n=1 Tax=Pusillimonas sp. SM2304 TaxID=3073241 RepID=UPI0038F62D2A